MWPGAHLVCLLFLSFLRLFVAGQGSATLWTSYVPLAVRSPYLNAWMDTTNIPFGPDTLRAPSVWPLFFQNAIVGWAGLIRIDNAHTFKWMGDPSQPGGLNRSVLTNIQITPTRTIMNMTAGPIDLTVTFLSPIEPNDLAKQSLPFSYLSLEATSNDGQAHAVQVYSDISAEWLSGNRGDSVNWDVISTDAVIIHEVKLVNPVPFAEIGGQASDTTTYYGMLKTNGTTYMADTDANCRGRFNNNGSLTNAVNSGPGIINKPFNVFAIAKDLGSVTETTQPVVWVVGMLRDPSIAYTTPDNTVQLRSPYWKSVHSAPQDAATAFLQDTDAAFQRAVALDSSILRKAASISSNYADLVSLTARQAMAGTELTISQNNGVFNTSDVKMFMKNIGTPPANRVNPVEVLYSSFPAFLYLNASYGGYLLDPILEYSNSSSWPFNYAPADIGLKYPNVTGNNQSHNQEVEQTGNMLIMTLAHARSSGDGSLLLRYYDLLKTWADYLVNNTVPVPSNQVSADEISRANSTNLAIKGVIGIQAMSHISSVLKMQSDSQHYLNAATAAVNTWKSLALSQGSDPNNVQHVLSNYGESSDSWSLPYNLFADKWLGTNLIPSSLYQSEGNFLKSLMANSSNGVSIDSFSAALQPATGNTAWTLFTAALISDASARDSLITPIWTHASRNQSHTIFPLVYSLDATGDAVNNFGSPGVGGIFAPLALTMPNVTISVPATSQSLKSKTNVGAIVGAIVGVLLSLAVLFALWFYCRRRTQSDVESIEKADLNPERPSLRAVPYDYAREQAPENLPQPEPIRITIPEPVFPMSSKARAAFPATPVRRTPAASAYTSSSGASSIEPPITDAGTSRSVVSAGSPVSPEDVLGLRVEVANLRRVMQSLQEDRLDPPPLYEGSSSSST